MITVNLLRLLQIVSYLLIVGQLLFYLFLFSDALRLIPIEHFLELRKTVDSHFLGRFKVMYYTCLLISLVMTIIAARNPGSLWFFISLFALICLIVDTILATRFSMPINSQINHYSLTSDINWEVLRDRWLQCINYRAIISTTGFLTLVAYYIFKK